MYIQGNVDHNDTLMFEKWIINVIPGRVLSVDQFSVFTFAARNSGHETKLIEIGFSPVITRFIRAYKSVDKSANLNNR